VHQRDRRVIEPNMGVCFTSNRYSVGGELLLVEPAVVAKDDEGAVAYGGHWSSLAVFAAIAMVCYRTVKRNT